MQNCEQNNGRANGYVNPYQSYPCSDPGEGASTPSFESPSHDLETLHEKEMTNQEPVTKYQAFLSPFIDEKQNSTDTYIMHGAFPLSVVYPT